MTAAPKIIVYDLDAHKVMCLKCRSFALCPIGRDIVHKASTAILEATRARAGHMGKA